MWTGMPSSGRTGSRGVQVVESPIEGVDDPHDLLRRDRQRRHQHHDVAQRAQQHAPGHGAGAHPSAPTQPRRRRRQLDADHEPALTDFAHLGPTGEPFSQQ